MYRVNFLVVFPDGSVIDLVGHALFPELTMAAARLSQAADNFNEWVESGRIRTYTASIERVVETVEK